MNLFTIFTEKNPNKLFFSIFLGGLAGLSYSFLIPILLNSIQRGNEYFEYLDVEVETFWGYEVSNYKVACVFLFACLLVLVARTISQVMLTQISMNITSSLRVKFYEKIIKAPITQLENIGGAKLILSITTDMGKIIMGASVLPELIMSATTLAGMLAFLFILNVSVFLFILKAIFFGVLTYQIPMIIGEKYFKNSRKSADDLQEAIRGLIYGIKELKLNEDRQKKYFNEILLKSEYDMLRADKYGHTVVRVAANYGDLICFFVIGIITFIFVNYRAISEAELIAIIMVLLYMTTPISIIMQSIPRILMARVALKKVNEIFFSLNEEPLEKDVQPIPSWSFLRIDKVTYQHRSLDGQPGFSVGPINLELMKEEICFITGGNGSGKSTLSKLISLHYQPLSGNIFFGNIKANGGSLNSCRQKISAVFSDYYLFDKLLMKVDGENSRLIENYLHKMNLFSKVNIKDGVFNTIALSDGQRRRLALLVALLENRDIYVFDEWAADQDSNFKEVFYKDIIFYLKNKGKIVVVITHDDRYFDLADKLVYMDSGKLIKLKYGNEVITEKEKNSRF